MEIITRLHETNIEVYQYTFDIADIPIHMHYYYSYAGSYFRKTYGCELYPPDVNKFPNYCTIVIGSIYDLRIV